MTSERRAGAAAVDDRDAKGFGVNEMDGPATVSELLSLLGSGLTPHDLAESMSNPLWYLSRLPIETDIAVAIGSLRSLRNRAHREIQHGLIDEFIDPPDPSDAERREFVLDQMRRFIPPETNADILAKIIHAYAYGIEDGIAWTATPNEGNEPAVAITTSGSDRSLGEIQSHDQGSGVARATADAGNEGMDLAQPVDPATTQDRPRYRRHRRL